MFGWTGKLLRIDLTSNLIKEETIPKSVLTDFMGGKGLGTYYLYKEASPRTDPLSPENRFYLATGPCQGTRIPITGRCTAISKSPLTNLYIDSGMGGYLGPELKRAGYDLLVVEGKAEKPVWIHISPNEITIKDAKALWGKTTHETENQLRKEDPKTQVISTGPAGERIVRIACLTHNYFRNFGRGGLGAIFGAKQLKAIAIRGSTLNIPTPDKDQELELIKHLAQRARAAKEIGHQLHYHGTPWLVPYANSVGQFPTRNFQTTFFESHQNISPEKLEASINNQVRRTPCEGCVISCAWTIKKRFSWAKNTQYIALPEYETLGLIGGNLAIDSPLTIIQANHLCNTLGLDTISTGNVIGLLMELTEKGLLPPELKSEGIQFGDTSGTLSLIQKIAKRQGIGEQLAEGSRRFAKSISTKAEELAIEVKGLEFPAWDPRGKLGLGLSYVTAAAGASHLRGWPRTRKSPETSASTVLNSLVDQQNLKILKDSLVICHFTHSIRPALTVNDCVRIYKTVTGIATTKAACTQIAERIWLLARLFNQREFTESPRHYDKLPPRLMKEPIPDGPQQGFTAFVTKQDFEESLTELYQLRGCDEEGRPTQKALNRLGLTEL